jgi:hypothetical protein
MSARTSAAAAHLGLLLIAVAVAGCGSAGDGIARQAVSGSVTLDGKPLDHGEITLSPIEQGPSAGGTIAAGAFAIDQSGGPALGKYRAMIVSIRPTGRRVRDADGPPGSTVDEMANTIPDRYNTRTELEIEVKNQAPNRFTFDLLSTPQRRR